jgi:hypothetical protein
LEPVAVLEPVASSSAAVEPAPDDAGGESGQGDYAAVASGALRLVDPSSEPAGEPEARGAGSSDPALRLVEPADPLPPAGDGESPGDEAGRFETLVGPPRDVVATSWSEGADETAAASETEPSGGSEGPAGDGGEPAEGPLAEAPPAEAVPSGAPDAEAVPAPAVSGETLPLGTVVPEAGSHGDIWGEPGSGGRSGAETGPAAPDLGADDHGSGTGSGEGGAAAAGETAPATAAAGDESDHAATATPELPAVDDEPVPASDPDPSHSDDSAPLEPVWSKLRNALKKR